MRKELIVQHDPKAPISEIFRTLRTNIQFMSTKNKLKTILVTSTLPGEGKSWVTSNLAATFAQAGKRVVIIDADMRKGRQYSIFGVSPVPGLSNFLSGIDREENEASDDLSDYIQETEIENLYLIPAGNIPPNPSELLISPLMIDLLDQLKELCDIIMIDGTPNELVTDSLILARLVDTTLIVTASKYTKKDNLQRVINNIQNIDGKIAGIVVNKIPMTSKRYDETYYYGSNKEMAKQRSVAKKSGTKSTVKRNANLKSELEQIKKQEDEKNQQELKKKEKRNQTIAPHKNQGKNNNIKNNQKISEERTNDILQQINEYLDQEKKNLK